MEQSLLQTMEQNANELSMILKGYDPFLSCTWNYRTSITNYYDCKSVIPDNLLKFLENQLRFYIESDRVYVIKSETDYNNTLEKFVKDLCDKHDIEDYTKVLKYKSNVESGIEGTDNPDIRLAIEILSKVLKEYQVEAYQQRAKEVSSQFEKILNILNSYNFIPLKLSESENEFLRPYRKRNTYSLLLQYITCMKAFYSVCEFVVVSYKNKEENKKLCIETTSLNQAYRYVVIDGKTNNKFLLAVSGINGYKCQIKSIGTNDTKSLTSYGRGIKKIVQFILDER